MFQTLVMAFVPEVVLDLYEGIPKDCFVAGVPFTLRGFPDDEIVPHFDTVPGPDGVAAKWIRFCDFGPFVDACRSYWMGSPDKPLYVWVMPYAPLREAFFLHELIVDQDELPFDASVVEDPSDQPWNLAQLFGEGEPELKQGKLEVPNGETFNFFVVNYRLLFSKAKNYCIFSYFSSPLEECERRLNICANLLSAHASRESLEQLKLDVHEARRRLALVTMEKYAGGTIGSDPHDALLAMYPATHDLVYQEQCVCFHSNPQEQQEPTSSTMESAMQSLGYEDTHFGDEFSIRQAEYNLLNTEGAFEFHHYTTNAHAMFGNSKNMISSAISPTRNYVMEATRSHCLMGELSRYEDGNPKENSYCLMGHGGASSLDDDAAEDSGTADAAL